MKLTLYDDVLPADERAQLRRGLDAHGWQQQQVADRGRLAVCPAAVDATLLARLVALAAGAGGQALVPFVPLGHAWLRLGHGDYQLTKLDALERPDGPHLELIADLSATATGEAEIFYSDGATTLLALPQRPGLVALVERSATLLRHQRYLTARVGAARVYRLRLSLGRR